MRGVDLSIAPGETVALLGPNGAGKSTTIDMLLGLLPPDAGTVAAVRHGAAGEAVDAGAVGAMLQTGALIRDLSVRELVADDGLALPRPAAASTRCSTSTGIADSRGRRTQKLSGGQTSACASPSPWSSNPDLLVLDEPTVAMDVEARRDVLGDDARLRRRAARRSCSPPTTWRRPTRYADRIVLMAHGRIVADGPATEIKARVGPAHHPGHAARRRRADARARCRACRGRAPRRRPSCSTCADSDAAIRALLRRPPRGARHRDHAAPGWRRPSSSSPATDATDRADD